MYPPLAMMMTMMILYEKAKSNPRWFDFYTGC
jgi:hypothetical protein